jgi:ParB family chromosome partitioning protein
MFRARNISIYAVFERIHLMAKRKRLVPLDPRVTSNHADPLSMTPISKVPDRVLRPRTTAPIADVAFDAANTAAMTEMADTLQAAQSEGRMIVALPLDQISGDYLVRDRLAIDPDEMNTLVASLRARGQQTPIEVVSIGSVSKPQFGLISGWRRLQALRCLADETENPKFMKVLALQRTPVDAADTYLAMVEENEIRVGLSYYERARVTAKALEQRVYKTEKQALNGLFGSVPRAKRSKIKTFMRIVDAFDDVLLFPSAISERSGLALARALQEDSNLAGQVRAQLMVASPQSADEEMEVLRAVVESKPEASALTNEKPTDPEPRRSDDSPVSSRAAREPLARGLHAQSHADGRLTLSGPALTVDLRARLTVWIAQQVAEP